jgi:hypothetical protein
MPSADYTDKYLCIASIKPVLFFTKTMIYIFWEKYLRAPTEEDTKRLMAMNEARNGQGCLEASNVCTPCGKTARAWHSIAASSPSSHMLEAVASEDLWIWYDLFFLPGSLNDMFCKDYLFLVSLSMVRHRLATSLLTAINIPWVLSGRHDLFKMVHICENHR